MLSKLLDVLNIKGYIILKILHMWAEGLLKIPKNKFIFKIIVCKLYLQWILNYYICYVFSVYDKKNKTELYTNFALNKTSWLIRVKYLLHFINKIQFVSLLAINHNGFINLTIFANQIKIVGIFLPSIYKYM